MGVWNWTGRSAYAILDHALAGGKELAWMVSHAALYPAGVLADHAAIDDPRYRLDNLSPVTRGLILEDIATAGTPIVLLHGIGGNRSAFAVVQRTLRRRGYGRITTVNYSPMTSDVREAARNLGRHIERVCAQTGYEQVSVIGHSMGGVIARYYVQRLGGDARVNTVITLGAPHSGTHVARLAPLKVTRQLRPDSDLMRELAEPSECTARFVAIYSDLDEAIVPHRSASLVHPDLQVTRIGVHGLGHLSLLVDRKVVNLVADALAAPMATDVETALQAMCPDDSVQLLHAVTDDDTDLLDDESVGYGLASPMR
jgi:pimeloyl-ACP methyl ester carboxylesterase